MSEPKQAKPILVPLVPNWLFEQGLSTSDFAVWAKLWSHRPAKPPYVVWPCRKEIMQRVRISKNTLNAVLNRLESKGLMRRVGSWQDGRKRVRYHLHIPSGTIIPNGETITPRPTSQTEGLGYAQKERRPSSQSDRRGRYKEKIQKEVCGVPPPIAHTHPLWFSEVQDSFPNVDCAACWSKFVAHFAEKGLQFSRERFEAWCRDERKMLRKPAAIASKVMTAPVGWIDWLKGLLDSGVDESVEGQLTAALYNQNFAMMPGSWQSRARHELGTGAAPDTSIADLR